MASLEFSDVVKRIVEQHLHDHVYTSMPAKVISVDNFSSNQTVDIQPQIVDTFKDNKNVELPPILDVPVAFPSAGGGILSFPIKVGDTVLAVFSQKSIEEWLDSRADNTSYTPSDKRSYSLNDAIAIPGLYTKVTNLNPNATDVELKFNNMSIRLGADGNLYVDSDSQINIVSGGNTTIGVTGNLEATASGNIDLTAPTVNLNGNVNVSGDLVVTGDASANEVTATVTNNSLSSHTHPSNGSPPTPGT